MTVFRELKNFTSIVSALLLSLMLLCAQGASLHVHYSDCNDESSMDPATTEAGHAHGKHARIHLVTDDSHHHHAKAGMSELDISPQGLLKNLTGADTLLLAIFSIFILLLPKITPLAVQTDRDSRTETHRYYALSPPLRAPPLG